MALCGRYEFRAAKKDLKVGSGARRRNKEGGRRFIRDSAEVFVRRVLVSKQNLRILAVTFNYCHQDGVSKLDVRHPMSCRRFRSYPLLRFAVNSVYLCPSDR